MPVLFPDKLNSMSVPNRAILLGLDHRPSVHSAAAACTRRWTVWTLTLAWPSLCLESPCAELKSLPYHGRRLHYPLPCLELVSFFLSPLTHRLSCYMPCGQCLDIMTKLQTKFYTCSLSELSAYLPAPLGCLQSTSHSIVQDQTHDLLPKTKPLFHSDAPLISFPRCNWSDLFKMQICSSHTYTLKTH